MDIDIQDIDSCNKKIKITIPNNIYKNKVKAYIDRVGRDAKVPGFRKGKIPQSMLEKTVGPEAKREVLTQLISEKLFAAMDEKGIKAVGAPKLLNVEAEEGTDVEVTADVEVFPEFEVNDYSGIEVEMKIPRVTDSDVDMVIEAFRSKSAKSVQVTDRAVQNGDFVKLDFTGFLNGKPFAGGEAKDYVLEVGANRFVPGFEEQLIGLKTGETKTIKVKFPEDYQSKDIAGNETDFEVSIKGIQEKELPELNDDFAKNADPENKFDTLDELKNQIRSRLEGESRKNASRATKKELGDKLVDLNPINLPESLIAEQIRFMINKANSSSGGETIGEGEVITPEEDEKHRKSAIKILQEELIVGKLAEDLEVKIDSEQLDQEVNNIMGMVGGQDIQKMKKEWSQNGTLARLQVKMVREKALDLVLEKIKVNEEIVDRDQGIADN
jgi:trigger factor